MKRRVASLKGYSNFGYGIPVLFVHHLCWWNIATLVGDRSLCCWAICSFLMSSPETASSNPMANGMSLQPPLFSFALTSLPGSSSQILRRFATKRQHSNFVAVSSLPHGPWERERHLLPLTNTHNAASNILLQIFFCDTYGFVGLCRLSLKGLETTGVWAASHRVWSTNCLNNDSMFDIQMSPSSMAWRQLTQLTLESIAIPFH